MINDIQAPPGGGRTTQRRTNGPEGDSSMAEDIDTAAIEATGATPADGGGDETEKSVVTSEELADTAPELGGAAVGDTVGDLLESSSDDEGDGDPVPETVISDKAMAEEMAYAEKPLQDALRDKSKERTQSEKEMLEWASSEAAETAMRNYIEGKSQMSEAEVALRERVDGMKRFRDDLDAEKFAELFTTLGMSLEERVEITKDAQALLGKVLDKELEAILADTDLDNKEKLERISQLSHVSDRASEVLRNVHEVNNEKAIIQNWERNGQPKEVVLARLWGQAIPCIAAGYIYPGIAALNLIAERTGRDVTDLIDEVLPEIARGKTKHNTSVERNTDAHMEGYGYLWRASTGEYVKV